VKPWWRQGVTLLLAGIVAAGLTSAWAVGEVKQRAAVQRDNDKVARMIQKMKTICIGRFLIDLPEETRLELRGPRIDGFDISSFDESEVDFQARLAQREAELRATPDRLGGYRNLESVRDVKMDNGVVGKIFVHGYTVMEGTRNRGLELERYRFEGIALEAMLHGQGVSFALTANDYNPDNIEDLPRLIDKLVPNPHNRIPTEPGFCIDRAWFRDPLTASQREEVMMSAQLPSHPDFEFLTILAAGNRPAAQSLLERSADAQATSTLAERWRITTLRAAPRTIGGVTGDELVKRVAEMNDTVGYSFWWEVAGTEDNVLVPHFVFKMTTGEGDNGPVPTSLSEDAAMALWDKISSSIRLRPTEPTKHVVTAPPPPPLGTYAWAGERCPESGWWSCSAGGNGVGVLGGQRQYIKKGERMPQALLLPPQTVWEKLRGVQPSFESQTQTSWKLVDKRNRKRVPAPLPLAQATPAAAANITTTGAGPSIMEQQGVPVGSFAATGIVCPASGWWHCEDPRALDGTRWFAQGSLLPSATFAVPPGAFGRSANAVTTIERRGAWRLVRLAEAPYQAGGAGTGEPS
jgi:hypothetical protein